MMIQCLTPDISRALVSTQQSSLSTERPSDFTSDMSEQYNIVSCFIVIRIIGYNTKHTHVFVKSQSKDVHVLLCCVGRLT